MYRLVFIDGWGHPTSSSITCEAKDTEKLRTLREVLNVEIINNDKLPDGYYMVWTE